MSYRVSRNIEASIIDKIKDILTACSFTANVEKTFARVYGLSLPTVCVRVGDTDYNRAELGDNATIRNVQVLIDIFSTSDGQRLDLKDCVVEGIKRGIEYYEYTIVDGVIQSKIRNGNLRVSALSDTLINIGVNKNELDVHDRYRHLISLNCDLGRVEV